MMTEDKKEYTVLASRAASPTEIKYRYTYTYYYSVHLAIRNDM